MKIIICVQGGTEMEDFQMYSRIQQEKQQGFSKEAAARHLNLNWRTVDQYWEMAVEDYEAMRLRQYTSGLDSHHEVILSWLRDFEDVSAAQIQDWLSEHYSECYRDRTVRDYVLKLRKQNNLPRQKKNRDYGPVPEMPPGQQMQAEFGVYNALRDGSRRIKLFFVVFILAHSRYKYIVWQTRHFTTQDFVRSLESCFEAIGGTPQELVIDQDRLMIVNENYGDIIFTQEFERCKKRSGFTVWLCRKSDPESKGMVESGVKYVKYNFARNRYFSSLEQWSKDCEAWLVRTGNGKKHEETKKIPAEVFQSEKGHLKPVISFTSPETCTDMVPTPVRKNNTIRYRSGRYSVPIGTYNRIKTVFIREKDGMLEIYDKDMTFIDAHTLASAPGELIINRKHARDTSAGIQELRTEVLMVLGNTPQAEQYLQRIQKTRRRYIRDQFQLILNVSSKYEPEILCQAVLACLGCDSDSATDFKDFANHLFRQVTIDEIGPTPLSKPLTEGPKPQLRVLDVRQHSPSVYQDIIRKGGQVNG
jgi:transposase